jgi:hypothetical protein
VIAKPRAAGETQIIGVFLRAVHAVPVIDQGAEHHAAGEFHERMIGFAREDLPRRGGQRLYAAQYVARAAIDRIEMQPDKSLGRIVDPIEIGRRTDLGMTGALESHDPAANGNAGQERDGETIDGHETRRPKTRIALNDFRSLNGFRLFDDFWLTDF